MLVVEDNEINQEVATAILAEAGLVVGIAANGADAVREAAANRYDLILMDVQMPLMDGWRPPDASAPCRACLLICRSSP